MSKTNDVSVVFVDGKKRDISKTKPVLRFANGSPSCWRKIKIFRTTLVVFWTTAKSSYTTRAHHRPVRRENTIYFSFFSSRLFHRRIPYGSLFKGVPVKCASGSVVRLQSAMWNRTRIYFVSAVGFRSIPLRLPSPFDPPLERAH